MRVPQRSYRNAWLVIALCLASCGGGEEAQEAEAAAAAEAPAEPTTPRAGATPAAPPDDEGFPSEWRDIRQAALEAFEPCMGEIEAGGPGAACVRYSELVVLFHQAEAFRLYECRGEEAGAPPCREAPADPVRQSEYDLAANPGTAPEADAGAGLTPEPSAETPETPDAVGGDAEP